jgi:hypothetical protein
LTSRGLASTKANVQSLPCSELPLRPILSHSISTVSPFASCAAAARWSAVNVIAAALLSLLV